MANLGRRFDADEVPPSEYQPIPVGSYRAEFVASEIKPTKSGSGQYIEFQGVLLDGEYQGRRFWDRINLWNENQQAVQIAERTFADMCKACGKGAIEDTDELHQIPFVLKVRMQKNRATGEMQNAYGYAPDGEPQAPARAPATSRPAPPSAHAQATPAKPAGKPWERKR
jgi:hypothetical protein